MRSADAHGQCAGRTAELRHAFGRPLYDLVQNDLGIMLVEHTIGLRPDCRTAAEHEDMKTDHVFSATA